MRRIERRGAAAADRPRLALGAPALDARLPGGGLPLGALHEVEGLRGDWDDGAATGFCLAILARLLDVHDGPVLWVSPHGDQEAFLDAAMATPLSMSERVVVRVDLALYRAQAPTSSPPTPGAPT